MMSATMDEKFAGWIQECQSAFGPAPRRFSWFRRWFSLEIPRPAWLKPGDGLNRQFERQLELLENGEVVLGCFVQANNTLFQPLKNDAPGDIVYPSRPESGVRPAEILRIGKALYGLKETLPSDLHARKLAEAITDELERSLGSPIPQSIAFGSDCRMSSVQVHRKHLPNGMLSWQLVPLLILPDSPGSVMILPCQYWPLEYRELWINRSKG